MNTVKIIHCADIHIGAVGAFLGTLADKRRYETLMTFERIIDIAKENQAQLIAIAGDLFDSNNIEKSFCDAVFQKISCVPEIKVVYVAGNHDPLDSCSPLLNQKLPDNFYILRAFEDTVTFDDLKLRVHGRSFENCYLSGCENFPNPPFNDDYINLLVLHGELKSDLNSNYNAITPAFVRSCGMDYIALGHVHKKSEIAKLGDTYFAYSGCPEGQGFDETDDKGIYIGNIGKGLCELEFLPISKRKHICVDFSINSALTAEETSAQILSLLSEKYGENYGENLYKIEIGGSIPEGYILPKAEICERLCEKVFFAKVRDLTQLYIDRETLANEITLKGIFVKNMLAKIAEASEEEKPLFEGALETGLKAFTDEVKWDEN